ncbi:hypothetical protein LTR91_015516 [Friedmanniomyces endolithicus]|uniref:Gfo/Idh/MocA-like oxidoreductase N-terminal domain-containing protein n=1 Tax=Friedmanniomyces endolithicus TaxID=329885 RepID=A0AAN6QM00_9PEZI|nr:hypothetical protein LTR57_007483 [Friedmanniomyces endolithicus]KAK0971445.1 hypothetical protein LTR91_015516 [Friedmanniomyces endolithicus]KAK0972494.1 hypothetical protein LTS01_014956 [Friedmanniomyces endolithicus]KAK1026895.1 hypothetical protein LTS16_021947 [Friedmanniomyces endolithicus]
MAPIKVGLLGYGFSTKVFHLPYILPNPGYEVYAFLQRSEAPKDKSKVEPGEHCTVDYPNAKHYRTIEDFCADPEIQLVSVCTKVGVHVEHAEKALLAGKHVVVEKPFTTTSAECDHLIEVAKKSGKILTVFQNRRYDSDFLTLKKLFAEKAFGEVTEFQNHYDCDNPPWMRSTDMGWSPGNGMLFGLGTHSIDQTLLFGKPKSVTGFLRALKLRGSETDDTFTVILQYDGEQKDLVCTVKTTVISPLPMERMLKYMVRGTTGAFVKTGEDPQVDHHMAGMKADDPKFGAEPESYYGYLSTTKDSALGESKRVLESERGCYMDYYRDVAKAIRGEVEVVVKPEQSRMGIRMIELARESAQKGVTLPYSEK